MLKIGGVWDSLDGGLGLSREIFGAAESCLVGHNSSQKRVIPNLFQRKPGSAM